MQVNITSIEPRPVPADKSRCIRYLIKGNGIIRNLNFCDDVMACICCLDDEDVYHPGESATVLRLLMPRIIRERGRADFVCEGNLINRPLGPYADIFRIEKEGNILHVEGDLKDEYWIDGSVSSQFFSGLYIAGCKVHGKTESSRYFRMTKEIMDLKEPFDVVIPPDPALEAFWNIGRLEIGDAREEPDMVPPWALQAAVTPGMTVIGNAGRLRYKESDRLHSIASVLNALGAEVEESGDSLVIKGRESLEGGVTVDSFGDHRIAMMAAVASNYCRKGITITGAECVSKSYPGFFDGYEYLEQ